MQILYPITPEELAIEFAKALEKEPRVQGKWISKEIDSPKIKLCIEESSSHWVVVTFLGEMMGLDNDMGFSRMEWATLDRDQAVQCSELVSEVMTYCKGLFRIEIHRRRFRRSMEMLYVEGFEYVQPWERERSR